MRVSAATCLALIFLNKSLKEVALMNFVDSFDGVRIVYTSHGDGLPALIFIHGGLADRTHWSNQIEFFGDCHKVIALDLAGHGESGCSRAAWSMQAFGGDVVAVLEAEKVSRAVLIGNSLGGPVAAEAALLAPERVIGIVAVDTFHEFNLHVDAAEVKARAEEFRSDFAGSVKKMVAMLFHTDADPALMSEVEGRLSRTSPEAVWGMFQAFSGYDLAASVRGLKVPIRCINGDLFPMKIESNRLLYADFDAVVLPHTGHYPMLECPEEFNRRLTAILADWSRHR